MRKMVLTMARDNALWNKHFRTFGSSLVRQKQKSNFYHILVRIAPIMFKATVDNVCYFPGIGLDICH
jgi:hypothetical protein